MSITDEMKTFAKSIGLDVVRVTSAEPFADAARRIKEQIQRGLRPKWNVEAIDAYCDPRSVLSSAKSIIVVAECYLTSEPVDLSRVRDPHGRIARYTWRNYYYDVKAKLEKVATFLKKKTQANIRFRCYSNGPLAEKPMAQRAGVGWYGKNGIILTRDYGSWVVLGALITNIALEEDEPLKKSCGNCQACIKACPTKALIEPYVLDMPKCLQHITHKQQVMPISLREIWTNRLYGCTTCQDVCPLNRRVKPQNRKPKYGYVGPSLSLTRILQMTEKEYRKRFHRNQIGKWWVSFGAIQRNAAVAAGNIGDVCTIPVLSNVLKHSKSFIVRGHVAWALGKIGGQNAKLALERAFKRERNPDVRIEIENALKF
ncbi:tRNA epoxyqueuosine(34) reductase QueG [Candidatus Bathyarchaeota archaeon]|nr:MAG: tRNA epoxyqueuosine(34) reductase QueG [Candidatus Bathyarchaeota archaeon]